MTAPAGPDEPCVAIIGMAGRFPGARSSGELWSLLREGREATRWLDDEQLRAAGVSESELADPHYVRATLALPGMEHFDSGFFGFSAREAAVLDPQHRHFIEACWEALEDAGHPPERFDGQVGVFGGCGMQAYFARNLLTNPQLLQSMGLFLLRHTGNDKDFLTTRVSYLLDLRGPSVGIQTACSTSLVAVHVAAQSLLALECDMALAGGSSIELPHGRGYRHAPGEILSPDGHCRAFDEDAGGTLFGSGCGVVVMRRLQDALRDGDHVYAVIRGSAINNDGNGKAGYLAPSVEGQARAAAEALAVAGLDGAAIDYVEAHGTGTPVGDPIEVAALTHAYTGAAPGAVGLGSLKTNIGHLDTAAGVASLIKVCLALRHGLLPPSLHYRRPNSRFDLARMPFSVLAQPRPWPRGERVRRAAVNSLGVGGTNAHVVLEEPPLPAPREAPLPWQLFTLSARDEARLDALAGKWRDFLAAPAGDFDLADAAFTAQEGRRAFPQRLALVARDADGLRAALAARGPARLAGRAGDTPPVVVFMFPGGGAQYPGAGRALLAYPAFAETVRECLDLLPPDAPAHLRERLFDAQAEPAWLEQPSCALPVLFILELALARLWQSWGVQPAAVVGHSAGEQAAACVAGLLSTRDALAMAVLRGRLLQAAPRGGMLSVDLPADELQPLLDELGLDIAAHNAPDLCIVSGAREPLDTLQQRLAERGVEARRLHVDVAAHSRLVEGAMAPLREAVQAMDLRPARIPYLSGVDGDWVAAGQSVDVEYWVRHLRRPVRFGEALRRLFAELPGAALLEVGPGQGLASLARHHGPGAGQAILASTARPGDPAGDLPVLLAGAGALWCRGLAIDWAALRGPRPCRRVPLPTYAFEPARHWIDPGPGLGEAAPPSAASAPLAVAPAAPALPALARRPAMADWLEADRWQPAPLPEGSAPAAGPWLVVGDGPLARGLRLALDGAGVAAHAVACDGDVEAALSALPSGGPLVVVHCGPLEARAGDGPLDGAAAAFDSPVRLAQALQRLDVAGPVAMLLLSAGGQPVAGGPVAHPLQALALGPCRVVPRELPAVRCRLVDLDPAALDGEAVLAQVRAEAASLAADGAGGDLAGWRQGRRWRPTREPVASHADASPRLRRGGAYLITGGFGGIALELAGWLARRFGARLALVSRRELPPRADWPRLAARDDAPDAPLLRRLLALAEAGAEVRVHSADVADRAAMAQVVTDCAMRWGELNGVFHCAGELADAPLAGKSLDAMHRLLAGKAGGALVLHQLLPGPLDVFALCSSTSVDLGPPGQVDYVAANAVLDALAASRPDGLAIRWGLWADVGMAARALGEAAAPPASGHPLLGRPAPDGEGVRFESLVDPATSWVLDEHRVAGRPVLPGTAYIELARAALAAHRPQAAMDLRDLVFEEALVFDDGPRRLEVTLRPAPQGLAFAVRSRAAGEAHWREHARASLALPARDADPAGVPEPAATVAWQRGAAPQGGHAGLAFGPRWDCLRTMRLAAPLAEARLELPAAFAADLASQPAHPALLDMACTFGLHLLPGVGQGDRLYAPVAVGRLRLFAPLATAFTSRVRLREAAGERAVFDIVLQDADGRMLASIEGFAMRAVDPRALARAGAPAQARREPALAAALREGGIRAAEAPALFERVLRVRCASVVASPLDLQVVRAHLAPPAPVPGPVAVAATAGAGPDPGLSPTESALAGIWRELLGTPQVAPEDDFFMLGGHSLVAVRLFARIRRQWGLDLPLSTLFEAPTLGTLAARLDALAPPPAAAAAVATPADASAAPSPPTPAPAPRPWSPLVEIRRGEPGRIPLLCVHGAGGNVLNFRLLSDRLGREQPVYGLQAQGVDGRVPPLDTIEAMAEQYLAAVRAALPSGPYRLAGYSGGGLVALHMAQALRAAGEVVDLLVMIDTLEPGAARTRVPWPRKLWLARQWSWRFTLQWMARRRRSREKEGLLAQAQELLARGEPLPPLLCDYYLFRNFVQAQDRYQVRPWQGDLVLLKARDAEMPYLAAGPCLGWEPHVSGQVKVVAITGNHDSMMSEPGLGEQARALREALAAADGVVRPPRADDPQDAQEPGDALGSLRVRAG